MHIDKLICDFKQVLTEARSLLEVSRRLVHRRVAPLPTRMAAKASRDV